MSGFGSIQLAPADNVTRTPGSAHSFLPKFLMLRQQLDPSITVSSPLGLFPSGTGKANPDYHTRRMGGF
jgi:predicted RNase H-like nuclease